MAINLSNDIKKACANCADQRELEFDFSMAFQPIVDLGSNTLYGYEALVRGLEGESAFSVISQVNDDNRYLFDQLCRVKAIALAAELELDSYLSINFLPNAVYEPERCIQTTFAAAKRYNFPSERIMFEFSEGERITDSDHLNNIVAYYHSLGFQTAIDDFGAGHSGLGLLVDLETDIVKFDMKLVRDIDRDSRRQSIVRHCMSLFRDLDMRPLAEGIETATEMRCLQDLGVELMQGFYFARPGFETLPQVDFGAL